jgi:glycosyltransferase involved in cell wall biosynthesis
MSAEIRILYVLRSAFGLMGTNSSYMVPSVAHSDFKVKVLDFVPTPAEQALIVFRNPEIDRVTYPRVPSLLRLPMVRNEIVKFRPHIVHHFYHNGCLTFPFFLQAVLNEAPRYIIDIRSPPLNQTDDQRNRDRERNGLACRYCDVIAAHAIESAQALIPQLPGDVLYAPPGLRMADFVCVQRPASASLTRFVYSGSLAPVRKLEALIEYFDELRKRTPLPLTLDIFGEGAGRSRLEAEVSRRDLIRMVTFRGQVQQDALAAALHKFDAGICYIPYDGFRDAPALKFMEYAAAGLAVFATDTPGMLKYREAGFSAEYFANDVESFCATVGPWTIGAYPQEVLRRNRQSAEAHDWTHLIRRDYYPTYYRLANAGARRAG